MVPTRLTNILWLCWPLFRNVIIVIFYVGHVPVAFVILHTSAGGPTDTLRRNLFDLVATGIGKWAMPSQIIFCNNLPKTRSGKIMRRILRTISNGDDNFGDISTLADPTAVDEVYTKFNQK